MAKKKLIGREAIGKTSGASELCFSEEVRRWGNWDLPKRVVLEDITCREGRQIEMVLRPDEIVHIAQLLDELGVPRIQVTSKWKYDKPIQKAISELHLKAQLVALGNGHQLPPFTYEGAKAPLDMALDNNIQFVNCMAVSDRLLLSVRDASKGVIKGNVASLQERELDIGVRLVEYAKSQKKPMNVLVQDFLRADFDFMEKFIRAMVKAGADTIILDDICAPACITVYQYVTNLIHKKVPEARLGTHCHNDMGNGLNGVLAAFQGGAEVLWCGVNALGERSGHTDLAALVSQLEYFYGFDTGIQTERLYETCCAIADITGQPIPKMYPIVGERAWRHVSDWHWEHTADAGHPFAAICLSPEVVGQKEIAILGEHPGPFGIRRRAKQIGGIPDFDDSKIEAIRDSLRYEMMWRKRPLSDDEFRKAVLRGLGVK